MAENERSPHTARGELALVEGRVQDAIGEFRQGEAVGQCFLCGMEALGRGYARAGQTDSAIAVYQRYVGTRWPQRIRLDASELALVYGSWANCTHGRESRPKRGGPTPNSSSCGRSVILSFDRRSRRCGGCWWNWTRKVRFPLDSARLARLIDGNLAAARKTYEGMLARPGTPLSGEYHPPQTAKRSVA